MAHQEISANRYLAQGLWRTALWIAGHDAMVGALIGVGGGVLVVALLTRKHSSLESVALVEKGLAPALVLTAELALAMLLLPAVSVAILGHAAREVFGFALFIFWAGAVVFLVPRTTEETSLADSVEGVWTVLVWLFFIVFLAHVWARVEPSLQMAYLTCGGLLAALMLYVALNRPVKVLVRRVSGRFRRSVALRRLHSFSVVGLGLAGLLWTAAGAEALHARGELKKSHPNLLIIAVDTLREDRASLVSKPSSGWDLTPNLREHLAPHGIYFTRAHSQAPWTMPSFGAIFTGQYPEEHGAQVSEASLLPHKLTLAEVLRDYGYRTLAVISGHFVSSQVGMLQGFEITDETQVQKLNPEAVTSAEVTRRALGFLADHRDEPFFMFVHYFDPHYQYQEHEEFHFSDPKVHLSLPRRLNVLFPPEEYFGPQEFAQLKALYAEEIAFTDQHLGRLLDYLDQHRLWDNTCVVFVSDHGDEFLEHGGFEHGHSVYEELVHVPLFVAEPGHSAPRETREVVETRWVFGTVLDMLGVPRRSSYATTPNLLSLPPESESFARSSIYGYQTSLTGTRYKLIGGRRKRVSTLPRADVRLQEGGGKAQQAGLESSDQPMLFDLLRDPGETKDLSKELPEITRRLRSTLETINGELARREEHAPMPRLSEDQKRKLRALGYL